MSDLNIIALTGRLTKPAEVSYNQNGTCITKFTVANNESRKNQDGNWTDIPSFFDCTVFGKYGESMAKYMSKGRLITVQGRLKQDRWEKEDQKYSKIHIIVTDINLLPTSKRENTETYNNNTIESEQPTNTNQEEIPFDIV